MNTITATVELANGWELEVEIDVVGFEPSTPGRLSGPPEDCYPGEGAGMELGTIRAIEAIEEIGIVEGQVIPPADLLGGVRTLIKMEEEGANDYEQELAYEQACYAAEAKIDAYDDQDDFDY
jgi:hypothetical protein